MTNKNMVKLEGFTRFVEVEDIVYEFCGGSYDSDGNGLLTATYAPIAKLHEGCNEAEPEKPKMMTTHRDSVTWRCPNGHEFTDYPWDGGWNKYKNCPTCGEPTEVIRKDIGSIKVK